VNLRAKRKKETKEVVGAKKGKKKRGYEDGGWRGGVFSPRSQHGLFEKKRNSTQQHGQLGKKERRKKKATSLSASLNGKRELR